MENLTNLDDLLHHQLRDIFNAENQLAEAMPEMAKRANSEELKQAFSDHLEETKNQINRLEEIGKKMDIKMKGETCKGMKGLIQEAKEFISEDAEEHVRDAGLIADAQRIEHYEISAYGTVAEYARALGKNEIVSLLEESLEEEKKTDQKLNKLAMDSINVKAKV